MTGVKKKGKPNGTRSGFVHQSGSSGLVGLSYKSCITRLTKPPHFYPQYLWNFSSKVLVMLLSILNKRILLWCSVIAIV